MRSIIEGDAPDVCYICLRHGPTEAHHMLHGTRRAAADKYGLVVHLCPKCHRLLHDKGLWDARLEATAQEAFERTHTREEWMQAFGKNYREE